MLVPELPTEAGRWPAYVTAATAAGVGAVFAFLLQLGALRIGVLTCYSNRPHSLTTTEISKLLDRAEAITDVLLDTTDRDPSVTGRELAGAVHLRNEVHQAQGMVAEQLGVGLGEALARIRGHAFANDLDLDALAVVELAGSLVADFDLVELLHNLTDHAASISGAAAVGLVLTDHRGELQLMAASDDAGRALDLSQIQAQEGPCRDSSHTREPVVNADLEHAADRWPSFAPRAHAAGSRSVPALPMRLRDEAIGALNLFGDQDVRFAPEEVRVVQALAGLVVEW